MKTSVNTTRRHAALATAIAMALAAPAFGADTYSSKERGAASSTQGAMSSSQGMGRGDQFKQADTNRDGKLTRSEFKTLQQAQGGAAPASGALTNLMDKRVKEVEGVAVLNHEGTKIGKVEKVVLHRQDNQIHAIVSVGGFLGIGETELAMPLAEMSWKEGKLVAATSATKEQLKERQAYDETAYQKIDRNETIAKASGTGAQSGVTTLSFESLDSNKDDRIDRSEFSAFESMETPQPSESKPSEGMSPSNKGGQSQPEKQDKGY